MNNAWQLRNYVDDEGTPITLAYRESDNQFLETLNNSLVRYDHNAEPLKITAEQIRGWIAAGALSLAEDGMLDIAIGDDEVYEDYIEMGGDEEEFFDMVYDWDVYLIGDMYYVRFPENDLDELTEVE